MSETTTEAANDHHDSHDHEDHGVAQYYFVFLALCGLTGISFLTYFEFWNNMISATASNALMMSVAVAKAMLVVLFFMHVKYEASWKYVLTIPCVCMAIFLLLALVPDVGMRARHYGTDREKNAANARDTALMRSTVEIGDGLIDAGEHDHSGHE